MLKQWLKHKIDGMENLMSFDNEDEDTTVRRKASLFAEAEFEKNSLAGGMKMLTNNL